MINLGQVVMVPLMRVLHEQKGPQFVVLAYHDIYNVN